MRYFVHVAINYKSCTFLISVESIFFDLYNVYFLEIVIDFIQKFVKYKCLIYIINIVEAITTFII